MSYNIPVRDRRNNNQQDDKRQKVNEQLQERIDRLLSRNGNPRTAHKTRASEARQLENDVNYNLTRVLIRINAEKTTDISLLQRKYGSLVHNIIRHAMQHALMIGHNYVAERKKRLHENFLTHDDLNAVVKHTNTFVDMFWRRVKFVIHKEDTVQTITKTNLYRKQQNKKKSASLTFGNLLPSLVRGLIGLGVRLGTKIHQFLQPKEVLTWHTADDEQVCPICQDLDGQSWSSDDPDIPEPIDDTHDSCRCYLDVGEEESSSSSDDDNSNSE